MMNSMDILQIIIVCAVILLPLGYYLRKNYPIFCNQYAKYSSRRAI